MYLIDSLLHLATQEDRHILSLKETYINHNDN
jgi:hypothetical protein